MGIRIRIIKMALLVFEYVLERPLLLGNSPLFASVSGEAIQYIYIFRYEYIYIHIYISIYILITAV